MPNKTKQYSDSELGSFTVTKRRNARRVTLRIAKNGDPQVSIPAYAPYSVGVAFIHKQRDWVLEHRSPKLIIRPGDSFELYDGTIVTVSSAESRNSTRHSIGKMEVMLGSVGQTDYFYKAVEKHLRRDSENVIKRRLQHWSDIIGDRPDKVRFRATTSRWGSCSSQRVITFSVFIAQLPNELIDYVVVHELCHLRHMNHSEDFWTHVAQFIPQHKVMRRELKGYELRPYIKKL